MFLCRFTVHSIFDSVHVIILDRKSCHPYVLRLNNILKILLFKVYLKAMIYFQLFFQLNDSYIVHL